MLGFLSSPKNSSICLELVSVLTVGSVFTGGFVAACVLAGLLVGDLSLSEQAETKQPWS